MTFLRNFGHIIGGTVLFLASFFAPHAQAPSLGSASFGPIQTQVFQIAGSGITNNATSVLLTSMAYSNGSLVQMTDLGSIGFGTIEPGTPKREEQVSFSGITQLSNGQALLTGVVRGLAFNPLTQGCNGSTTLSVSHAGGVNFVLSNTACFYQQFAITGNTTTITGAWNFSSTVPTSNLSNASDSANPQNLVTQANLASTSFAGVVNGSPIQKGIFQEATRPQLAAASGTGSTGADLVITPLLTASSSQATTSIVVTNGGGTIDPSFVSSTQTYSFNNLVSASTTLNGTTTVNGPLIVGGTLVSSSSLSRFGGTGADGAFTLSGGATGTINLNNASVTIKNYTSISITGTSSLSFLNAPTSTGGAIIILRSQGACTLTSATTTMIDLTNDGGSGGAGAGGASNTGNGGGGGGGAGAATIGGANGSGSGSSGANGTVGNAFGNWVGQITGGPGGFGNAGTTSASVSPYYSQQASLFMRALVIPGSGGGGGGNGQSGNSGGKGGTGGGALYMECGSLNFTGTITATGSGGAAATSNNAGAGGGGGGGSVVILYNTLTANSGTITVSGGSGNPGTGSVGGNGGNGVSEVAQNISF
jgi:hypothetical protein